MWFCDLLVLAPKEATYFSNKRVLEKIGFKLRRECVWRSFTQWKVHHFNGNSYSLGRFLPHFHQRKFKTECANRSPKSWEMKPSSPSWVPAMPLRGNSWHTGTSDTFGCRCTTSTTPCVPWRECCSRHGPGGSLHCWRLRMFFLKKEHCVIAPRMESGCMGFVILGLGNRSKHVQVKWVELTESFPPNSKTSNKSLYLQFSLSRFLSLFFCMYIPLSSNSPRIWNKGSSCLICNWEFGSKSAV